MIDYSHLIQIRPRTRQERTQTSNKEQVEKDRLSKRVGNYFSYEDPSNILGTLPNTAPGYANDSERFFSDFSQQQKNDKIERQKRMERNVAARQMIRNDYEQRQISQREEEIKRFNQSLETKKDIYSQKQSKVAYDVITHEYHDNDEGKRLAYEDEKRKYETQLRRKQLYERANSSVNPVTGEPLAQVTVPREPERPNWLNF
eukprot:TRINITY_DN1469_c0_g1_i1.p1 TRINITY_DN1469_c0_g1~~TRINITY_DN1469_c0_g1_i1.p1  ORF type:complete len:202 (+),score=54.30 TRINITY_DN1469_c0_g1_i1:39-644(+)